MSDDSRIAERFLALSRGIAAIVVTAGVFAIFGWTFNVDHLKSVVPGWVTMKPLTAACRIFCGVSLWLQARIGFESGSPGTPGAGRLAVAAEEAAPGGG